MNRLENLFNLQTRDLARHIVVSTLKLDADPYFPVFHLVAICPFEK